VDRLFHSLDEQVEDLQRFADNPRQRIRTGLPSLDGIIEGPAAGEVILLLGRSHTAKSMLMHNILLNNPEIPMVFFSIEMPMHQAVTRLYASWASMPHDEVQAQLYEGRLPALMDEFAQVHRSHVVVPEEVGFGDMALILEQYTEHYQERPACVLIDYLDLINDGGGDDVNRTTSLARMTKMWAKSQELPIFMVHQSNMRINPWEPPTENSARGAGYTESDAVVGFWMPSKDPELSPLERSNLAGTVNMNVIKNRINGRTTFTPLEFRLQPSLRLKDMMVSDHEQVTVF
jgi:replicative DNA helicase